MKIRLKEDMKDLHLMIQHIWVHPFLNGTPCDPFGDNLPLSTPSFPSDYYA
ncbi:hypothetical protein HD554DRAFT_2176717 [Boletus coccyginus]|nr:hypothetical protein HD554DRAFT_2176717 [Boletus coccyginus]